MFFKKIIYRLALAMIMLHAVACSLAAVPDEDIIRRLEQSEGVGRCNILLELAGNLNETDPSQARKWASEALKIATDKGNLNLQAKAVFQIAETYLNEGDNVEALGYYLRAEGAFSQCKDSFGLAQALDRGGLIYRIMGDYGSALEMHLKANAIFKELDSLNECARSMINTGVAYRNLDHPALAMKYYQEALQLCKLPSGANVYADGLISIGNIYWYDGKSDEALRYYNQALNLVDSLKLTSFNKSGLFNNIGNAYRQKGDYSTAQDFYQRSYRISSSIGDKNMMAVTTKNLGITWRLMKKYSQAIEKLSKAGKLADSIRLAAVRKETLEELSNTYSDLGNYRKALEYYRQFADLREELNRESAKNRQSLMELGYQLRDESSRQTLREVDLTMQILRERNIRNVIVFIAILAIIGSFFIWWRYKSKLSINLELEKLNAELEQRVEERTRLLREENERRRIAQAHAEKANATKNRFLANISHEVRTPINAIIGFCDLTIRSGIEERHRMNLRRIKDSSQHLLGLIKGVLDYSQLDEGKIRISYHPFPVREAINSVLNAFYLDAKSKQLELKSYISEDVPDKLAGDREAFQQILYQLVGNAVKFTETGEVSISVQINNSEKKSGKTGLQVSVKDTGIGISKMKQKLIFLDFNQGEDDEVRKFGGTGLGLTIASQYVRLMGGEINVESEKGKGSNFTFTVYLDPVVEPDEDKSTGISSGREMNILIAEDNPLNAQVITAFLGRMGHTSEIAVNGRIAIEKMSENRYDVVLMDIEMPEMDGLEATRKIRSGEAGVLNPDIPIIALTAHALKDYEDRSFLAGMNEYLTKPVDFEQLQSVLLRYSVIAG